MTHLKKMARNFMNTISLRDKPRPDPEPLYQEREMTGILGTMSREQIEKAFAYDGPITAGSSNSLK